MDLLLNRALPRDLNSCLKELQYSDLGKLDN